MRVLAMVTQKGGSGKSTLSASLAVEAQANRERVVLIDMDPQRSVSTWARNRNDADLGAEAVAPEHLRPVLDALAAQGVTLAIIDTPASLSAITEAAILAADVIAIPVRPTVFDVWSSEATWRRVHELGREPVFVLSQCPIVQGSRRFREGVAALEAMGGLLKPAITARVDYQDAISRGLGPTELDPDGAAAVEVRELWRSMRRRLARATWARRAAEPAADAA